MRQQSTLPVGAMFMIGLSLQGDVDAPAAANAASQTAAVEALMASLSWMVWPALAVLLAIIVFVFVRSSRPA
jgi:hypothetical protein